MYNKNNLAVGKVASKSSIKPELACIAFYGNRTVATDSFRVIEVSAEGKAHDAKMLPAKEVMQRVKLSKDESVELDRIETITGIVPNPHHQYPDIDQVFTSAERNEDYVEVNVNAKYLAELATIMSKVSDYEAVTLRVPTEKGKPVLMLSYHGKKRDDEPQKARALLMPMNK